MKQEKTKKVKKTREFTSAEKTQVVEKLITAMEN